MLIKVNKQLTKSKQTAENCKQTANFCKKFNMFHLIELHIKEISQHCEINNLFPIGQIRLFRVDYFVSKFCSNYSKFAFIKINFIVISNACG